MTDSEHSTHSHPQQVYLDDEIDLRQYIEVLIRWWREILLIAFGFAVLAGLAVLALRLLPPKYEASAEVAIVRVQSDVTFDEKFTTTSDAQTTTATGNARRGALVNLVKSEAIAQKVIEQLGEELLPDERDARALIENTTVNSAGTGASKNSDSDLIQIVVQASSAEKAAKMATAWAAIFVKEANSVYGQTPDELLTSVKTAQIESGHNYETRQAELVNFLTTSRVDELNRQIISKEQIVKALQSGEESALQALLEQVKDARSTVLQTYFQAQAAGSSAAFVAQHKGQQEVLTSYIDKQYQSQIDVFRQQYEENLRLLQANSNASVRLQKVLGDIAIVKKQIDASGEIVDGGTIANLQLLKLQTVTDMLDQPQSSPSSQAQTMPTGYLQNLGAQQTKISGQSSISAMGQPIQIEMQMRDTPLQLQINTDQTMDRDVALSEVESLTSAIQSRLIEIEKQTLSISEKMLTGQEYHQLQSQLAPDSELAKAIQKQKESFEVLSNIGPPATVLSTEMITSGLIAPFLNFTELQSVVAQYVDSDGLLPTALSTLEAEIRELKSEFEQEQSKLRELTQQRDLAWSTFTTVNSKVEELTVAKAAAGSEVRFAAEAVPPVEPIKGPSLILSILLAGLLGLLFGASFALVANSLGSQPSLYHTA